MNNPTPPVTLGQKADLLLQVRGTANACLLLLEDLPTTPWSNLSAEFEKAKASLYTVSEAMDRLIEVED